MADTGLRQYPQHKFKAKSWAVVYHAAERKTRWAVMPLRCTGPHSGLTLWLAVVTSENSIDVAHSAVALKCPTRSTAVVEV
jgi:hypothetical protein